jgi:phosphotriesterase-related protein
VHAVTVTGERDAASLGFVLPHEHLHCTSSFLCQGDRTDTQPLEAVPMDALRRRPMDYASNLDLREPPVAAHELQRFAEAGGGCLVELTTPDLGRDPPTLRQLSETTGVAVVMGTGYYTGAAHPPELTEQSIDEVCALLVDEIVNGVGHERIRAGVIGEIGTSDPLLPGEEKVVRAAARAQRATGCPINVHFAAGCREVFHVLDILRQEGIHDLSRVIVSHMDVVLDVDQQRHVADAGAIVEYDTFGHESYPDSRGFVMPTDQQRVLGLTRLREYGLLGQVLVSHDVCFRSLWSRYGGRGYDHLLNGSRRLMNAAGLSDVDRRMLSIDNPARIFAFVG